MRRILIPLCLVIGSHVANGQRAYQTESPDRLFVEGKEMFSLKNYSGCIDKLTAYKQQSTNADLVQEADYMMVCAAYEQGRPNVAELLKNYLEVYPSSRHADEVAFLIGSAHFGEGEYERAIYWFNQSNIDLLSPDQQEAYCFRLAYALLQQGDQEKARGYFARIEQVGKRYKEAASYYVAYIDYARGSYPQALQAFNRLKENPAYKEQSLYYITQIYFIQNKYSKVIDEGKQLLAAYPNSANNGEVYRMMGNSAYHLGDEAQAIKWLDQYMATTEKPLRGDRYILGVCSYNKGDYAKAVKQLSQTVRANDALSQSASMYLGQSYLKLGQSNNARMSFESAATASFDKQVKEAAMYNYALLVHETGFTGFGESVRIFEDFLNDFPNSQYADKVNDYLVETYLTTKNYESALRSIQKINQPSHKILEAKQDILFQLGTQAFANAQMEEAIDRFSQAIEMGVYKEEARNEAYFWRGESYYRLNNYRQAISDYRTYLNNTRQRNTDTYALAHYSLGYSYFKEKDYSEALSRFRQYTDLESNRQSASYADAFNRIGDCLFHNRQFAQAEEQYSKAAQILPSAGDYALYQKGFVMGLQKDYQGKISMMDRLISEYPSSSYVDDALFEKGRAYVLLDNNTAAARSFEQLIKQYPESALSRKAGIQLGLIYFNDGRMDQAAAAYKAVIDAYPGSDEAKVALQDLKSVYVEQNNVNAYAAYVNSLGGNVHLEVSEQDSLTYIAAEKLFMRGDNAGARQSLENYLQQYPSGAFSTNAHYYLGAIAFAEKQYATALPHFEQVVNSGDPKFMEESVARTAEIHYLNKSYSEAMSYFEKLLLVAETPENKEAAKLGTMRCAEQTGQLAEAVQAATGLLKEAKLSPEVVREAHYVRAKAYTSLNQETKALADWKELSKDTRTAQGAEAKYRLAQLYFDQKKDSEATKVLEDFAKNGTPHQYWLARGFILWADIFIRQGDEGQARVYLNSLQNNYQGDAEINAMIEDRLAKLK
mgnify:CR=1 FL=1